MIDKIIKEYNRFKERAFSELRFNYSQFLQAINNLDKTIFDISEIGKSFEERQLFLIKAGKGEKKVIFWSQMHGNEPISTQGLFDLLCFLSKNDEFSEHRKNIFENCTLYFFPLVNPDGNEIFTRRNAQGIDLNRDAIKLTSPEAKLLNNSLDEIKPDFAFNLHDQERYYGTPQSNFPTALSFLTPSFNFEKTIDNKREKSMKLIATTYKMLQNYLPKSIAKYSDAFMPNAFGDNVQAKSIATILVEAGYIIGDEQRQNVRKYYFATLLYALLNISTDIFQDNQPSDYQRIPMNIKLNFVDIILKNITIKQNGKEFVTDIAIIKNILDTDKFTDLSNEYLIWDIGDLSNKKTFSEIDCSSIVLEHKVERLQNAQYLLDFVYKNTGKV